MNISLRSFQNNNDAKRTITNKPTTLNPNAAEFVPSALRSSYGNKSLDASRVDQKGASGKAVLDRSESNVSNNSDDEAHQYWRHQLPDDITPDFKVVGEVELPEPQQLSLAGLSIHDGIETSRFSPSRFSEPFVPGQTKSPLGIGSLHLNGNLGYPPTYTEDKSSAASLTSAIKSWDKTIIGGHQQLNSGMGVHYYDGDSRTSFVDNLLGDQALVEEAAINPSVFSTSQNSGFSAERLADVYYANGCNLNSTTEMLRQLELQADAGFSQTSEVLGAPRRSMSDFPSVPVIEAHNGLLTYARDFQQASNAYISTSNISRGVSDISSTVSKNSSQDSIFWKYESTDSADGNVGSNRSSQLLASSFDGHGKLSYGDRQRSFGAARAAPVWLETEAVANTYSGSRVEAHDITLLRNACLEQASQAYLIGNKALSRELNEKGQLYNMQMKAALLKAGDTVYQPRSPSSPEVHGHSQGGQERLIDLHNLHINEALLVLKHELSVLRSTAGSSGQRPRAMIRVSSGHQAKDTRIRQRLPIAVEQFLLAEGLHYTRPQPGLLNVVIF